MEKQNGIYKFKYTELKNNIEITNEMVIETKDVVRSIGRFGASRQLINLSVKQLNNIKNHKLISNNNKFLNIKNHE